MSCTPISAQRKPKRTFDVLSPTGEDLLQEDKRPCNTGKLFTCNMGESDKFELILTQLAKLDPIQQDITAIKLDITNIKTAQTDMQLAVNNLTQNVKYVELQCTRLEDEALKNEARFNHLERRNAYLERELGRQNDIMT
jgi:septal ring factor EnvC (AmiA/AmiB activator)